MANELIGLVPAAGYAKRLGSLPCSKEVLEVGGKPVMDYVIERMRHAGCTEVRVITRPDKRDVVERAQDLGAVVVSSRPETAAESILTGIAGLPDEATVLIGFPDTIWTPIDGLTILLEHLAGRWQVALGLFETPDVARSDAVFCDDAGVVTNVSVKQPAARSRLIWGCAAARVPALYGLSRELELGHYFDRLARERVVLGVRLSSDWIDIGTKDAFAIANACAGGELAKEGA